MASASVLSNGQNSERDFSLGLPQEEPKPDIARLAALARHLNFGRDASDGDRLAQEHSSRSVPLMPTIHASPFAGSPGFKHDQVESDRPSLGRRIFRSVARFFIVALIGAGVTLAWQSHSEEAKEMMRTQAPSVAWLLPAPATKSPSDNQVTPTPAQELKPMAVDLAAVRRSVEQLVAQQAQVAAQQQQIAAQQERITQSLAALQALEQEIKQKVSSPPPSRAVTAPPRKPLVSSPQSPAVQPSSGPAQPSARQPLP
jgi:hypothetical protein